MDLVASCKDKLAYFRIKELKDVLTQLGLSKQGKKQDLVDRILAVLSDERVSGTWAKKNAVGKEDIAKLVDDTYRKMQVSGAPDLASKSQAVSESSNVKFKEEVGKLKEEVGKLKEEAADSYQMEKIRCTCGSALQSESMIKCEDPRCHVWQHINCVIIPEKPMEGLLPNPPEVFYCELCRLSRADPFWMTISNPLYPVKMCITNCPADGTNPVQNVEKNFQLTRADKDLLLKQEYDVQAWCMLLNDKVPFRMQWPQYADLQINGVPVRAINRPGSQLLGANGRDDGPIITGCTRDGINKFSLTGCDARVFCIGVRIVKRRTVQQILNMIPKETEGELFKDALARVRRCVGGGTATENADSDSDLEVVADFFPVNLRCPMSGSRMKIPGRFKPCIHMGCFDLEVFVEMNQRSRKWQCPICLKNYALENIIIDPYFNQITSKLLNCAEDVTEIEVKPDGSWRAKLEGDRRTHGELALWHLPDGTLSPLTEAESKPKQEIFQQIKQEYGSESHAGLKLGMKKNPNGIWEIRQPNDALNFHSGNLLEEKFQNVIPMSSSATGSGGDDASVNQNGSGGTTMTGIEFDSVPMNIDTSAYGHAPSGEPVVIVLSDSEEENDEPFNSNSIPFSGIPDSYQDNVPLGLFNTTNDDDFGMHMWSLPPNGPGGPGGASFQLFGSEAEVTDNLVGPDYTMGIPESSVERANNEMTGGLVDNPLAFSNDPALQIFLPTRPSYLSTTHADLPDQGDMSNGVRNEEDLITLTLGGGGLGGGSQGDPMSSNGLNSGHQSRSKDGAMDSVADTASLLVNMSGDNSNSNNRLGKTSREMSDSLFQFPRQRRSVRPRLYLSIDSDSE